MLSEDGLRTVSLTNSDTEAAEAQLRNAGLTDLFEKRYSVESVKMYKPHMDTYRMVIHGLCDLENSTMPDKETNGFLRDGVGEDRLKISLVDHFFQLGKAGEAHADESWTLVGLRS